MFRYIKFTFKLIRKKDRFTIFIFSLVRIFLSGFDLLGIVLVGVLISKSANALNNNNQNSTFTYSLNFTEPLSIQSLAVLVLVSFLLKSVLSVVFMKLIANTLANSEKQIASDFYAKILGTELSKLNNFSSAQIVNSVTYSINYATTQLITIFIIIASEISMLISILILFSTLNVNMTISMGIYFLIIGLMIQKVLGTKLQSAGQIYANSINVSSTTVSDSIQAFREITTLRKQKNFISKFDHSRYQYAKAMSLINFYSALPRYIVESALMIGVVALTFTSFNDSPTPNGAGTLGIFLVGGLRIVASMLPLQNSFGGIKQLVGQAESFYELKNELDKSAPSINLFDTKISNQEVPANIKFLDVSFKYPNSERYALRNLNLQINPGEQIAVIGPSGAGKSTMADMLVGLTKPTSGELIWDSSSTERLGFSYVPQTPGIIHGTIAENITFTFDSTDVDYEQLSEAIDLAHLTEFVTTLPEGVNTDLGAQSNLLSGGQLQRIGLARALYGKPRLLVLDEATSALDAETENTISENLEKLKGKCTTVIIAHRLSTVQNSDRVIVLDNGEIVGIGKFSELANTNSLVSRYIELSNLST